MTTESPMTARPAAPPANDFFVHSDGATPAEAAELTSTTRYLSGACYVDEDYAERVIREVIADSHRAIAPAIGYDLETVVRHGLRARGYLLAQNALLCVVMLAALVVSPSVLIWLVEGLVALRLPRWIRRRRGRRWAWLVFALLLFNTLSLPLFLLLSDPLAACRYAYESDMGSSTLCSAGWPYGRTGKSFLLLLVVCVVALLAVLVWSRTRLIRTIAIDLAPGRATRPPRIADTAVRERLETIREAQRGNVVLHSSFSPFLGAGVKENAWSIALELRPDQAAREAGQTATVPIDPVRLVGHLRRRLAALRSHQLPEPERMTGLQLRDQIVAAGARWHGYPLVDQEQWRPYPFATPEAVDAIIRHPQTSARHFLRTSVGAQEKPARTPDDQTLMPSEHQSIIATTFVHVAVEGGMLYIEVVECVLGPLEQRYLDIDRYTGAGWSTLGFALLEAVRGFGNAVPFAPVRVARTLARQLRMKASMSLSGERARREPVHDFGARAEAREMASRADFATYTQKLDSEKYLRLISKRITEAVVEFLTSQGVDASEYQRVTNVQQFTNVTIGDSYGPVAMGASAQAVAYPGIKDAS